MEIPGELDGVLQEIMRRWDIPGLAVGIVKGGETVYCRFFGVQSLQTMAPVTPDTIFCTASVSKCFTACAVMQLVEADLVSLDEPLVGFLPEFTMADSRVGDITLRQMLCHTSGIHDLTEHEYDRLMTFPETDDAALERFVNSLSPRRLSAAPGERFLYSNIAYNVLGYVVAYLSGMTFEGYMHEYILFPAGMAESTFFYPIIPPERLAVPHLRLPLMTVTPHYPYHRADAPSSFLHATLADMCAWITTSLKQDVILSPSSYAVMWTPAVSRGAPPFYEASSPGWTLGHYDGWKTVSHGGMGFGWTDFLVLLPELDCGAVILCNEESFARSRTVEAVVQAMLGREPQVGTVSWMVPVSRALAEGGMPAARKCVHEALAGALPDYVVEPDGLTNLAIQLSSGGRYDLAQDVLQLNLDAFPGHAETLDALVRLEDVRRQAL